MDAQTGAAGGRPIQHDDLEVAVAVRRDLGPDSDSAVIAEFLDRLGSTIDERVDARVVAHTPPSLPTPDKRCSNALGVVSVLSGIPITAIVLGTTHGSLAGVILLIITWVAIAVVNLAYARRR